MPENHAADEDDPESDDDQSDDDVEYIRPRGTFKPGTKVPKDLFEDDSDDDSDE